MTFSDKIATLSASTCTLADDDEHRLGRLLLPLPPLVARSWGATGLPTAPINKAEAGQILTKMTEAAAAAAAE